MGPDLRPDDRYVHLVAGQTRKVEVEHQHIGSGGQRAIHRTGTIISGGDHIEPGVSQVPSHGIAPHRMVIRDDHAHHGGVGRTRFCGRLFWSRHVDPSGQVMTAAPACTP